MRRPSKSRTASASLRSGPILRAANTSTASLSNEPRGEFIPLAGAACDWIVRAIEWSRRQPRQAKRLAVARREARREQAFDSAADDLLDEALNL